MGRRGVQEGVGLAGVGDAAGKQQLGEDLGQAGCFGQGGGLRRMRLGEDPTLEGALARGRAEQGWLRYWAVLYGAH